MILNSQSAPHIEPAERNIHVRWATRSRPRIPARPVTAHGLTHSAMNQNPGIARMPAQRTTAPCSAASSEAHTTPITGGSGET